MARTLYVRLQRAMRVGGATPADLATWLDRGYQTVYSWAHIGREPRDPHELLELHKRLDMLDFALSRRDRLVPRDVSALARQDYIRELFANVKRRGIPQKYITPQGAILRTSAGDKMDSVLPVDRRAGGVHPKARRAG